VTPKVCVYGLWHLGVVYAACLARQGVDVVGLDPDAQRVADLRLGRPPVAEPGLPDLIAAGLGSGKLTFTDSPGTALETADTLWVTFDTPIDDEDTADVEWVRRQLARARDSVKPGTMIVISSQVPVGFASALRSDWATQDPTLTFVSAPENLRLGRAIESFQSQARVVIGVSPDVDRQRVESLFRPICERIVWMSLESAEMTKHSLNAFLAMSVAYTNEVARICERVGADAAEVEQGLRSDPRIGAGAYVKAGAAIAGGTLARDVRYLAELAERSELTCPIVHGIQESHRVHLAWSRHQLADLLSNIAAPHVALLGLTYKVGTDTLRRSSALELAVWLKSTGATVAAYDPAIREPPNGVPWLRLGSGTEDVLRGADAAVVATPWPVFAGVDGDQLVRTMRRPQVVDEAGFLPHLAADVRIHYLRVGRPSSPPGAR
jgi:UDPglucose 6-dehydrogenase